MPVLFVSYDRNRIADVMELEPCSKAEFRDWYGIARDRAKAAGWRLSIEREIIQHDTPAPCTRVMQEQKS